MIVAHLCLLIAIGTCLAEDVYDFQTLPPLPPRQGGRSYQPQAASPPVSDALLTDWEGKHWASLDADQDKVALSWNVDQEYITFQVRTD